ncbi:hypothetical protein GCM10023170_022820 [Phytohabitans houttuyneae]|uniref:Uncharacterized protein n=1 Tax=Phytohabitans houttuyneae TaxID=1076126 RepID=A0A6V8KH86_9ACTN|nr:hypothetical protein Phou_087620 [Phytohabitans houttuyneae]
MWRRMVGRGGHFRRSGFLPGGARRGPVGRGCLNTSPGSALNPLSALCYPGDPRANLATLPV